MLSIILQVICKGTRLDNALAHVSVNRMWTAVGERGRATAGRLASGMSGRANPGG
jgi:hypothetical protein